MGLWKRDRQEEIPLIAPPETRRGVIQVCHPHWRGVRESARGFEDPLVPSEDLALLIPSLEAWREAGIATVVIHGWPPGSEAFARAAAPMGINTMCVYYSAPPQHGVDGGEAEAVSTILSLSEQRVLSRIGTVKEGVVESLRAIGYHVEKLEARVPKVTATPITVEGAGPHVGVFLYPMWRKNVTTQALGAMEIGATVHVMHDPGAPYLPQDRLVVHGELGHGDFLDALAGMDLSLNVTFAECQPVLPMESYRLGVPCLVSRTSSLFSNLPELYELSTVDQADNPHAIAVAAQRLLDNRDHAVQLANASLDELDRTAQALWLAFTDSAA